MVKIRTGTVVSVVALLGFALSITGADDSWGGMAQYAANSHEQQPTDAPVILEGTGSKESEDDQKPADNDDDTTDAPSNSWSPASSNEDSDNDTPDAPRESRKVKAQVKTRMETRTDHQSQLILVEIHGSKNL
ncbi:hypothetical protein GN958_ATG07368 [Phytophthora infestans]|uniref:Secreted RxLR effector peptide protein n=1 Tax=Phytophthora infestans TaxID=4787 RepID=A0A8S9UWP4_PHYIN|nr:hypothetical protein GN958_ATG07368 [Phytophthora infestans]